MSVLVQEIGPPRAGTLRGGDVRAYDLAQNRNVFGPHVFAASTHLRLTNGLLRLDVGPTAAAPRIDLAVYRGGEVTGDLLSNILTDVLGGTMTAAEWVEMGTVTFDSPTVTALLTGVRLVRVTPERATVRLIAPAVADVFLTLRRGERMVRVQHGSRRGPTVDTDRRIRWTDSPSPTGTATSGRVTETTPVEDGMPRFLASLHPVTTDGAAFSMTALSTPSATFGAGVGTTAERDTPADMHAQLAGVTTQLIRVA